MSDPVPEQKEASSGCLAVLFQAALALSAAGLLFLALIYYKLGPRNIPKASAGQYTALEEGDEVIRAYTGIRWLDSQRYFVIKPPPERFAELVRDREDAVSGKDAPAPGESVPGWWDVEGLDRVFVDDHRPRPGHTGETRIYAPGSGLIYVIDR